MSKVPTPSQQLLSEVFRGQYDNFRGFLEQKKVLALKLNSMNIDASGARNLAIALQGTQVTTVDLSHNKIYDRGASDFTVNLKDTQVTTVVLSHNKIGDIGARDLAANLKDTQVKMLDLSGNNIHNSGASVLVARLKGTQVKTLVLRNNHIDNEGAKALAMHIPDTLLLNVELAFNPPELTQALELNRYKLLLFVSPYYHVALKHLPESEKGQYFNLGLKYLTTEEGRLRYAGGILMNESLPEHINEKIIGYLPYMTTHNGLNQTKKYRRVFNENHPDGLKVKSDSKIEKIEEKIRTMRI
jgi:hypothetical protein